MGKRYAKWMNDWETRLCMVSTDRVVRPFEWGLEWTDKWPVAKKIRETVTTRVVFTPVECACSASSDDFFAYTTPADFQLAGNLLRFTSPVETPHHENNQVHGQWFPAKHKPGARRVAAVVLPHWNAQKTQHNSLCAGLAKLGISALRLSLPYHDYRMPGELKRADYAVSSNVARTIDATRQAVIDTRCWSTGWSSRASKISASWAPAWAPATRSWPACMTRG